MKQRQKKVWFLLVIGLFMSIIAYGQGQFGVPFIQNFTKKDYAGAIQNRDCIQDRVGVVYFANNDGLLSFDGQNWQVFALDNRSFLRSIALDSTGIIYAGGQKELGYFSPNNQGKWTYHSLLDKIPQSEQNFDDIWDIVIHPSGVYFRAVNKIFKYKNGRISTFSPKGYFNFLGILNGKVVVQDGYQDLVSISDKTIKPVLHTELAVQITAIVPIEQRKNLIATLTNGFFLQNGSSLEPWAMDHYDFFQKNEIYSTIQLSDGNFAVGTSSAGFVVLSPSGKIIFHIQRENGLHNNTVLCVREDQAHNLWLGLDNGISQIEYNSPFSRFFPDANIESTGYAALSHGDFYYFGTSNGVYSLQKSSKSALEPPSFTKIPGSDGQVRSISYVAGKIVVGHHKQAFLIEDDHVKTISPDGGYWEFERLQQDTNYIIAGTYHGLSLFDKQYRYIRKIDGFDESSRFVEQDEKGNIWVAHPNKGIYKLKLNNAKDHVTVIKYGAKEGLPSDMLNHVFKIKNELLFSTSNGIFSYDTKSNTFLPNAAYNRHLKKQSSIKRLVETQRGDVWYVSPNDVGVLKVNEKSITKEIKTLRLPQIADQLVDGFEGVFPIGDQVIFSAEQGFIYYDSQKKWSDSLDFSLLFSEINLTNQGDSTIFFGNYLRNGHTDIAQPDSSILEFPFRENGIRFNFSSTKFFRQEKVKYRYKLEGLEDNWSLWTTKSEKEYNNLQGGHYTFSAQAKDEFDNQTPPISYQFKIRDAWYASTLAYIIYWLTGLTILWWMYRFFAKKYSQQKEIVQQSELIIDQLKHEKLEAEIMHKNRELISTTLHLAHKNEIFKKVKTDINKLAKTCTDLTTKKNLKTIIQVLSNEEDAEAGWEEFVAHFNKLHTGFFDRLKTQYPDLSPKDLKMCAYLRMNLTTKEIATLSNITTRGVEGARYRLRKKFGLTATDNLVDFLMNKI